MPYAEPSGFRKQLNIVKSLQSDGQTALNGQKETEKEKKMIFN